jgi:uncharacterized membrane protein
MMHEHPVIARYMASFEASITALDAVERTAIAQEIRNHIAEATAAGRPLDDVLRSLGPAETLARAYVAELLMNPRRSRLESAAAFLKLAGIVVAGSAATLIVVTMLGSVGIGFTLSGLLVFGIGLLETAGIHLSGVQLSGIPPGWVTVMSAPIVAIGVVALVLLRTYIRFVARTMRKTLPRGVATA